MNNFRTDVKKGALLLAVGLVLCGLAGCGEKKVEPPRQYSGWQKYSYKHFVYHFPADSYWGKNIERLSSAYERYLSEMCSFLAIEIPKDTIHFYIHDNPSSGKELTGHDPPYVTDNQIHWGRRSAFGVPLAMFLVNKMRIRMTDFQVLYDGLITLLDYSQSDYHHLTSSLFEIERYIPLDTLIDNESFARAGEKYRSWEAASMVAYIAYTYGINRFKMLWQSTASFDRSVQELFGADQETFEKEWHEFALQYYKGINIRTDVVPPDTTNSDD
ncbi:MAG: hypothetical protein JSV44_06675 [Candidatus Zixiibacteriota bacterium]|nr:MAG: hypothetical protein JSV44_06675 [candidate division Zixibacteria bacterium]